MHGNFAIFGVIVPIGIIILLNMGLFFMIAISHTNLVKIRNKYLHQTEQEDEKVVKKEFVFLLSCFINTGMSWLFGFLVTIPTQNEWIYMRFTFGLIFCLLNSTQGFQIFFTYFIISNRRRDILGKMIKQVKRRLNLRRSQKKTKAKEAVA